MFQPLKLGKHTAANRIALQPIEGTDGLEDGTPGKLTWRRYERFAKGGAGLIWFEAVANVPEGRASAHQLQLTEKNLDEDKRLVAHIKEIGLKHNGYHDHGVDLRTQLLEIALCMQHNNGGLAVNNHWQTNLTGLYAVGEAAATHGVYRPGGSALNAGQCGAVQAAGAIAENPGALSAEDVFLRQLDKAMAEIFAQEEALFQDDPFPAVRATYMDARRDMDSFAGPIRNEAGLQELLRRVDEHLSALAVHTQSPDDLRWYYRLWETLVCQRVYVQAMLDYLSQGGKSRGSAMYLDPAGDAIPHLCKAMRLGYLSTDYADAAKRGYEGVIRSLEWKGDDLQIGNVCIGTGVGDYQHYINRPTSVNNLHGAGAFLLMCTEMQMFLNK